MRDTHPQIHVTLRYRGQVTNKKYYTPLSQGPWTLNLVGYWSFCFYYDRGFRRRNKLADPSIILFLSFFAKVYYINSKRKEAVEMQNTKKDQLELRVLR